MSKTFYFFVIQLLFAAGILSAQQVQKTIVYFDYDNSQLNETSTKMLKECFEKIDEALLVRVTVTGYTDADGGDKYNLMLSQNRAKTVLSYLVLNGIPAEKIKMEYYGESKPVAQNDSDEGKQQNRRVELLIETREPVVSDIFSKFSQETQYFKVSPNDRITIKGKEGTVIHFPPNVLCKQNGDMVREDIEIELKEFYRKSDIVSANLHTMSGDRMLETGGMIYLSVTCLGEQLKIRNGSEVEIEFASKNKSSGMETFVGEEQGSSINWTQRSTYYMPIAGKSKGGGAALIEKDEFEGYGKDTAAMRRESTIDHVILKTVDLGWINCDRFYKVVNKTDLIVEMDTTYKPVVRLVFKDINSVMPGYYTEDKKIVWRGIPVGQKATIIAFSAVNEEPYFAMKDIVIAKDQKENLKLVKTTMAALKQELKRLD